MSRHKKTREQKILADQRRENFVYTLPAENLTKRSPSVRPTIASLAYAYVRGDVQKTLLLTLVMVLFQITLLFLLKNHILKIPGLIY